MPAAGNDLLVLSPEQKRFFDDQGYLVGLGLSIIPTQHSYKINGHQLYVWCAADAWAYAAGPQSALVIPAVPPEGAAESS